MEWNGITQGWNHTGLVLSGKAVETKSFMDLLISREGFDVNDPDLIQNVAEYIQNAAQYNMGYDRSLDHDEIIPPYLG